MVVSGEKSFLVFLKIALVAGGQGFQRGEKRKKGTSDAASFTAEEFPRIRIFLLGHQAAAGGVFVGKNDVGKFLGSKEDEIFGQAREVRGNAGEGEEIVEREVAVAYGVEAIGGDTREAEIACQDFAVKRIGIASDRARAHRASIGRGGGVLDALKIAGEGLGVGHEEMREENGLGMLHVGHARHRNFQISSRLGKESPDQSVERGTDLRGSVDDKETKVSSDELIATAAGVEFPADGAKFFD